MQDLYLDFVPNAAVTEVQLNKPLENISFCCLYGVSLYTSFSDLLKSLTPTQLTIGIYEGSTRLGGFQIPTHLNSLWEFVAYFNQHALQVVTHLHPSKYLLLQVQKDTVVYSPGEYAVGTAKKIISANLDLNLWRAMGFHHGIH